MQPSVGLCAESQVGQLFHCRYGSNGYVRRRLAFVGLLVLLTLKTLLSTSIRGITLSIDAVDSALMLWVAPAECLLYRQWTAVSPAEVSKVDSAHSSITIFYLAYGCVRSALMKGPVPKTAVLRWSDVYVGH